MNSDINYQGKAFAVLGFIFEIGMLFAYGFGSNYYDYTTGSTTAYQQFLIQFILMALFTMVGFGLLLSYIKVGTLSGLTLTLLVVVINIQLGLLMQKFWFNVFTNGFTNNQQFPTVTTSNPLVTMFAKLNGRQNVQANVTTFRLTLMNSISILVAFTGFIGRLKILQAFVTTLIFNIGWNLAYFCNVHLNLTRSQAFTDLTANVQLFDDFGTNNVYIFGAFFGFVMLLTLNIKQSPVSRPDLQITNNKMSKNSNLLGLIGTAFIFATFAMTGRMYTQIPIYNKNIGFTNIIFALSASVIGTYIISALLRQGNVGIREAMLGTISGGVAVGNISSSLNNVAASIAIGLFVGILAGLWYTFVHPKINKHNFIDSHGIFGAFFLSALVGAVIIGPTSIAAFINLEIPINPPTNTKFVTRQAIYMQLAYTGVAAGAALVSGFFSALISLIFRNTLEDFNDGGFFQRKDFGLFISTDQQSVPINQSKIDAHYSAENLKRQ